MEPSCKKRKLYRRYLRDGSVPLPRTTKYRMEKTTNDSNPDGDSSDYDSIEECEVLNHPEHPTDSSDAEEGRINDEPEEQSVYDPIDGESDGTDANLDFNFDHSNKHFVYDNDAEEERQSLDSEELFFEDPTGRDIDGNTVPASPFAQPIGHSVDHRDAEKGRLSDEAEESIDEHIEGDSDSTSQYSDFEDPLNSHISDDGSGGGEDSSTSDSEQMINDDMMRSPMYKGASVTLGQTILLLMTFAATVGLTQDGLQKLLQLLIVILPQDCLLPPTKYLFKKLFKTGTYELHAYCPSCSGNLENDECKTCHQVFDKNELTKKGNFFFTLPLISQLKHVLENLNLGKLLNYRNERTTNSDTISDVMDGKLYEQIANESNLKKDYSFSFTFNTDGVPIFKSSSFSIWPLLCYINELPPNIRKKHMFLTGLWFGVKRPAIPTFFRPFISEMKALGSKGFEWRLKGKIITSYVYALICSCDSVARASLQNIKQFNGNFGCNWCLHPGDRIQKGRGYVQVYPYQEEITERSHQAMIQWGRNAAVSENYGVKGPTPFRTLPFFDVVSGFIVDSMHCIDLGVMRKLATLWFDSSYHKEPWYIGNQINALDRKIKRFQPPSNITRLPRSIITRAYWKASEWRAFLLFYAPIVLKSILPSRFFAHLLLLCQATYVLQTTSISQLELFYASQHLNEFVHKYETLYGRSHMTYNVHILLHLSDSVRNWGPLWCYSAYSFEGCNGTLLKLYNGTQSVPLQIVTSFLLLKHVESIGENMMSNAQPKVKRLFGIMIEGYKANKYARRLDDTVFFGHGLFKTLNLHEKDAVEQHLGHPVRDEAMFYHKAYCNSQLFLSIHYRRKLKRDNTLVRISDGSLCQIVSFVNVRSYAGCEYPLCLLRKFVSKPTLFHPAYYGESRCQIKYMMSAPCEFCNLIALDMCQLSQKCVAYRMENSYVISLLPNSLERD